MKGRENINKRTTCIGPEITKEKKGNIRDWMLLQEDIAAQTIKKAGKEF